jgi:hypothetical protein
MFAETFWVTLVLLTGSAPALWMVPLVGRDRGCYKALSTQEIVSHRLLAPRILVLSR